MPLGPFGSITLDGIQFSTDPDPYEPLNWPKRESRTMTIGGRATIQDFGVWMRDNSLRLGSGQSNFLDLDVVKAFHLRYRTRGATYILSDWLDNVFRVFIRSFIPVPFKKGGDQAGNPLVLFTYTMELYVTEILQFLGDPYPGG